MRCPFCQSDELKVTDSREAADLNAIRRRRECLSCCKRFTTFETVELTIEVKKRDGSFEEFNQQKLIKGLAKACSHTTVSHERVIALASSVTADLMDREEKEITTELIGELVMKYLKDLDPIAYIRFACVYRRFKEISELMDAIKGIQSTEEVVCN
jgi:transcriptional repressor NrdR